MEKALSTTGRSKKKKGQPKAKTIGLMTEVSTKKLESDWYIPPVPKGGIPKYSADDDKNCPRGQMARFNDVKKQNAQIQADKGKSTSDWIKTTLKSKFVDVPLQTNSNFATKVLSSSSQTGRGKDQTMDMEIIQKIIIRENMLVELHKLIENQSDVNSCMSEVFELMKAIRWQTIDIVEGISEWRRVQVSPLPFLFRGVNYLLKIPTDLDFLDQFDEVVERFCFEFKYNPFAYKGGGDTIFGPPSLLSAFRKPVPPLESYFSSKVRVDGIELFRLKSCEKTIQDEFDRMDQLSAQQHTQQLGANGLTQPADFLQSSSSVGAEESVGSVVWESRDGGGEYTGGGGSLVGSASESALVTAGTSKAKKAKGTSKFRSERKLKQARVEALTEEANELKAIKAHIEDKVNVLAEQHKRLGEKRQALEAGRRDALQLERHVAAQQLAIEVGVVSSDMQSIAAEVKDLQRQAYFITLERTRKKKLAMKLSNELEEELKRADLEKKLAADIKKMGLMGALASFKAAALPPIGGATAKEPTQSSPSATAFEAIGVIDEVEEEEEEQEEEDEGKDVDDYEGGTAREDKGIQEFKESLEETVGDKGGCLVESDDVDFEAAATKTTAPVARAFSLDMSQMTEPGSIDASINSIEPSPPKRVYFELDNETVSVSLPSARRLSGGSINSARGYPAASASDSVDAGTGLATIARSSSVSEGSEIVDINRIVEEQLLASLETEVELRGADEVDDDQEGGYVPEDEEEGTSPQPESSKSPHMAKSAKTFAKEHFNAFGQSPSKSKSKWRLEQDPDDELEEVTDSMEVAFCAVPGMEELPVDVGTVERMVEQWEHSSEFSGRKSLTNEDNSVRINKPDGDGDGDGYSDEEGGAEDEEAFHKQSRAAAGSGFSFARNQRS